tara:strand:- start:111 stop:521 length:411 start_codon:yes stop_codon:yes gene_type:complete
MNRNIIKVDEYDPVITHLDTNERDLMNKFSNKGITLHKLVLSISTGSKISYLYDKLDDIIMEFDAMTYRKDFLKAVVMKYLWSLMVRPDRIAPSAGIIYVNKIEWIIIDNNKQSNIFKTNIFNDPISISWNPLNIY